LWLVEVVVDVTKLVAVVPVDLEQVQLPSILHQLTQLQLVVEQQRSQP